MKKLLKSVAIVAAVAAVGTGVGLMAGCGDAEATYNGEYKHANAHSAGKYYGCKVEVKVKDGKITAVKQTSENTDSYTNITSKWDADGSKAKGFQAWLDATFVGKTVTEVKSWSVKVEKNEDGSDKGIVTVKDGQTLDSSLIYTGATQTTGRTILAVQNALKDVK